MVTITIDDQRYTIPERLSVQHWASIANYDVEEDHNWPHIITAVTGAPYDDVATMSRDEQKLATVLIVEKLFRIADIAHKDFDTLTFGDFIDLEYYIAIGIHKVYQKALDKLEVNTKWADEAQFAIHRYMLYRANIMQKQYKGLFGFADGSTVEDVEDYTPPTPAQVAKRWYTIVVDLANDDIMKLDEITQTPLKVALNFMAHRKEKVMNENRKIKQQQRQYELQRGRR